MITTIKNNSLVDFEHELSLILNTHSDEVEKAKKIIIFIEDILKQLTDWLKHHVFETIQEEIKEKVPMPYLMTVTRRFMMRVVDEIRARRHGQVIINGESLGQVASQTLGSMTAINAVTTTPVIRPVVTMDKLEIIELAEKIDTFNISIQPFEDCCTIFAPPQPKTKPKLENAEKFEARMDINNLVKRAVDGIMVSQITGEMQVDALEAAIQDLL